MQRRRLYEGVVVVIFILYIYIYKYIYFFLTLRDNKNTLKKFACMVLKHSHWSHNIFSKSNVTLYYCLIVSLNMYRLPINNPAINIPVFGMNFRAQFQISRVGASLFLGGIVYVYVLMALYPRIRCLFMPDYWESTCMNLSLTWDHLICWGICGY